MIAAGVFFASEQHAVSTYAWLMIGLVITVLVLDGADGYLARRFNQASDFGARFDMEIDALHILVLSSAAWIFDKAGWWVLAIGFMRYAFVAAGWAVPRLAAPLAPSMRRKVICVFQVAALCVMLAPLVTPPLSTAIAAVSLALLLYSFAVDAVALLCKGDAVEDVTSSALPLS